MLEAAIAEVRQLLREENVLTNETSLERYRWCTLPFRRSIAAVVRPGSVEEIQQIVHIANTHHVSLYPISTGRNWGYGAAQPVRDDNIVVDLSRMDRVVEVNTELAYAVVEP